MLDGCLLLEYFFVLEIGSEECVHSAFLYRNFNQWDWIKKFFTVPVQCTCVQVLIIYERFAIDTNLKSVFAPKTIYD